MERRVRTIMINEQWISEVDDDGWWRDVYKIWNISKNILEQTIQIMRHEKGKNKGVNRFLAI
jgi:hypothetical protein